MGQQIVTYGGREYGFITNGRGVINAVPFFDTAEFADPATNWAIPSKSLEVRAVLLHHWAGWYGPRLTETATASQEFDQLVACARDHRTRFGIGPGYNLIAFPSGRVWAVGRHGTHRAHTKGREVKSMRPWNEVGRGACVAGNLSEEPMTQRLAQAVRTMVAEVMSWPGVIPDVAVHEHGLTPTVNSAGTKYSQATECPGRALSAWRAQGGLTMPNTQATPDDPAWKQYQPGPVSYEPEPLQEVWRQGYRVGRAHQARDDHDALMGLVPGLLEAVRSPRDAEATPPIGILRQMGMAS
ncbi:MAG: hypothetical protein M0R73_02605 [Dehalococcoidia bacterium]|nr:hypothetical protein [Dehalococcoidia bacterium]